MPRGIPSDKAQKTSETVKLTIELLIADHEELVRLAANEYRTPALQAAYLLAHGLRLSRGRGNGVGAADIKQTMEKLAAARVGAGSINE